MVACTRRRTLASHLAAVLKLPLIHRNIISVVEGYRIASKTALAALEASSRDNGKDPAAFREDLLAIARTTLSSKVLAADKDYFATLAVDAVLRLKVRPIRLRYDGGGGS